MTKTLVICCQKGINTTQLYIWIIYKKSIVRIPIKPIRIQWNFSYHPQSSTDSSPLSENGWFLRRSFDFCWCPACFPSWSYNSTYTPLKTKISPAKWWLEDVFPIEIYSPFFGDMLIFRGVTVFFGGPNLRHRCSPLWNWAGLVLSFQRQVERWLQGLPKNGLCFGCDFRGVEVMSWI